jgi:phosphoribosylformylglycinamidine synthase subunit PurQ / glutaminase
MFKCVAHALMKQCRLQAAAPQFGNRSGPSEQCDTIMNPKHSGSAGLAVNLGKKAGAVSASRGNRAESANRVQHFRIFGRPAAGADICPQASFVLTDPAHNDAPTGFIHRLLDRTIQDAAYLNRLIFAGAEHIHRRNPGERAHFVHGCRAPIEKETLDLVERGSIELFEKTKTETLRDRGIDAIENCQRPRAFDPLGAAFGEHFALRLGETDACPALRALQTSRQGQVRKQHGFHYDVRPERLVNWDFHKMKVGVIVFPGSNCDHDAWYAINENLHGRAEFIWHQSANLRDVDAVLLPGGFSYGDYLRCGAIARFSPVMNAVKKFAADGGLVLGVCNGFQILVEAGLLPGALLRNRDLKFICRELRLQTETTNSPFTSKLEKGQTLRLPIAHGEGRYFADERTLDELEAEDRVTFRYLDNPNGSTRAIAGILNRERNVMGMMPHPERACDPLMGSTSGLGIFESMLSAIPALTR